MDSGPTSDREQRIEKIVEAALPLTPGERALYLESACRDEALRRDVETAIARYDVSGQIFGTTRAEGPTAMLMDADTLALSEDEQRLLVGDETHIGPYRVVRRIGQGGMGAVYLAERDDAEFRHQVAIKLIKRGMDSEFVLRRFRNERQILAGLNHPNIARLLDGGHTVDGRPYFVMEHIEGKPITLYADEQRLTTPERLKLFQIVCGAIHYAHQNLVIHRDIKPSNILVTADGTPKLLDFGIAKLLNPDLAADPIEATAVAIRLMTPEYASPEQVRGEPITTASDVYSLGVLLYELLTGHRPYRIHSRAPHELARVVCEEEPQKPSTAIRRVETYPTDEGTLTLTPESVSSTRDGNPDKLQRRLRGDLDNVVLMAMRKEPERRYASVDQFSNDIRRHLDGRPVIARKDTVAYRTVTFIKRHKAGVLAAVLIAISLIAGVVATLQQRARAERRFNDVRQLANSLFEVHDAIEHLPGSTPARELIVNRALEYLDSLAREAGGDVQLQRELATAYQKVGDVQGNPYDDNLGDRGGALASYEKALAIREEVAKKNPTNIDDRRGLAISYVRIGDIYWGTGETEKAVETYQKGMSIADALIASEQLDLPDSLPIWRGYHNLAYALAQSGDLNGGIESLHKAQSLIEKIVAAKPDDPAAQHAMAVTLTAAGEAQGETGDLTGAIESFRKALVIDAALARTDPNNVTFKTSVQVDNMRIADVYLRQNNPRAAIDYLRQAYTAAVQFAADDPSNNKAQRNVAAASVRLGQALEMANEFTEAMPLEQRAVDIYERVAAADPSNQFARAEVGYAYIYLSVTLAKSGNVARALEFGDKSRGIIDEICAANPTNVEMHGLQSSIYAQSGDVSAVLAESERQASQQADRWRTARDWYQRSYDILKALKDQGQFVSGDYGTMDEAAANLARADAALAKLNAATGAQKPPRK